MKIVKRSFSEPLFKGLLKPEADLVDEPQLLPACMS